MQNEENVQESTTITNVETTIAPVAAQNVDTIPIVAETIQPSEATTIIVENIKPTVVVTEIPIETSTGIIAGIVAHGSTVGEIVTDLPDTTATADTAATSVTNNAFVPVVITNDDKSTVSPSTTKIVEETLITSTASILSAAENNDATTIVVEKLQPLEATTIQTSQSIVPIAPLGEEQDVAGGIKA
uniref:Uncharacterized protein n=1 Tax=Panagrolaimus superbus TaxID=310955 RepID=A0A914XWX4_9BILA